MRSGFPALSGFALLVSPVIAHFPAFFAAFFAPRFLLPTGQ
jgi:hypothetical protein